MNYCKECITKKTKQTVEECSECKQNTLLVENGSARCSNCGYGWASTPEFAKCVTKNKYTISVDKSDRSTNSASRPPKYYNLDVIISVGYRVKSKRGIEFRKWASKILKQYMIDGYVINEKRLHALQKTVDIQTRMLADALNVEEKDILKAVFLHFITVINSAIIVIM